MSMFVEKAIPKAHTPAEATTPPNQQTSFHTLDARDRRRQLAAKRAKKHTPTTPTPQKGERFP